MDNPFTVDYATADGTAQAGTDYIATSGTLTFAPTERIEDSRRDRQRRQRQRADRDLLPQPLEREQRDDRRRARNRDDRRRHSTATSTTTTSTATAAATTSATTATASATAAAATASGPLSCPESARAATRRREDEDPASALLGRQHPPRSLQAFAARPRGEPVTAARHDQAPELPGQAGARPELTERDSYGSSGAPLGAPLSVRDPGAVRFLQLSVRRVSGGANRAREQVVDRASETVTRWRPSGWIRAGYTSVNSYLVVSPRSEGKQTQRGREADAGRRRPCVFVDKLGSHERSASRA